MVGVRQERQRINLVRAIHDRSQRKNENFARLTAQLFPPAFESELFGRESVCFTGATRLKSFDVSSCPIAVRYF